jgi:8-oxo-dGTP pyrophosphatase MutT (NUDIX family)
MDQIVEDPDEKAEKEAHDKMIKKCLDEAMDNKTVWYTNKAHAEEVKTLGGDNWNIEMDEHKKVKYKPTAIIVLKDSRNFYLIVQGNQWTDVPNNRPVYDSMKNHVIYKKKYQYMIPKNTYGFVKGSIEKDETDIQAAQRELKEETGLELPYSYFTDVEYFTTNKDPRTNPVFTISVPNDMRDKISKELKERNHRNEGEIFSHHWAPIRQLHHTLNSNSKAVRDRIMSKRVARGGKTRRSIRSKRRRTHKNYTK